MDNQINTISKWLGVGSINIFGWPFAGKDTQAKKLAEIFGGVKLGGGEILRNYHDQNTLEQYLSSGKLIPTDLYLKIVLPYLSQSEIKEKPLILSSLGRLKGEETVILEATANSGHPTKAVVLLNLLEQEIWQRFEALKNERDRGERSDDKSEVLKIRLQEFKEKTLPVIDFYRNNGLLIEVDGSLSRDEVTNEILKNLFKRASK